MRRIQKEDNYFLIVVAVLLWIFGLGVGSGIGMQLHLYECLEMITLVLFIFHIINQKKININILVLICYVIIFSLYTYFTYGSTILDYVWLYLLVFLIGKQNISPKILNIIGVIYGALGLIILVIARVTSVFSGWDGNGISMISFFSYTLFVATRFDNKSKKRILFLITYSIAYFALLNIWGSRGSILFSLILLLGGLNLIPLKSIMKSNFFRVLLLFLPLIIAIIVVNIRNMEFVVQLNSWSLMRSGKPIFNGRDAIWSYGFETIREHLIFGTGNFAGNWHNSAVTCLVGTGIVGYCIWVFSINGVLKKAKQYWENPYVFGLAAAFMIIWLQQSVELGLIQVRGQIVPFVILGLMCARVNILRREKYELQAFGCNSNL